MSRKSQASSFLSSGGPAGRAAASALLALALSGCAGGFNMDRFATDKSIVTGSVSNATKDVKGGEVSDAAAIRMTILGWDRDGVPDDVVPWANAETGSAGAITKVADTTKDGELCRSFRATRESFDGVGAYRGLACRDAALGWAVRELEKL